MGFVAVVLPENLLSPDDVICAGQEPYFRASGSPGRVGKAGTQSIGDSACVMSATVTPYRVKLVRNGCFPSATTRLERNSDHA